LAAAPPAHRAQFEADLRSAAADTARGVVTARARSTCNLWQIWTSYCVDVGADPFLLAYDDPIPLLQVYALRYRLGTLSASGRPVKKRQVEEALRAIGQTLSGLGFPDPRFPSTGGGKLEFRLRRQLAGYQRADPAPSRVKPIPIAVLQFAAATAASQNTPFSLTLVDMLILAFFFLLRPGEYVSSSSADAAPFRFANVHLFCGNRKLHLERASDQELWSATFVGLEFTNQKNCVKGEIIGLGRSGSDLWCPVRASIRRIIALRRHHAPPHTPLHSYWDGHRWCCIASTHLTAILRTAILVMGDQHGLQPSDVTARSLRTSGAMALLCANVDTDRIRLIGRWRSDEMFRYLHTQAAPLTKDLALRMLNHGSFVLIPNTPHAALVQALM